MEAESSTRNQQQRKRKRNNELPEIPSDSKWRTDNEHRLYSSKLLEALRRVRSGMPRAEPPKSRAVREAADRALAISARGRTRWSRAILSNWSIRLRSNRIRTAGLSRLSRAELQRSQVQRAVDRKKKPEVVLHDKARVLGKLVPGCKKLSLPMLLEEASDYIAALEMQVKAMSALTEILSMIGGTGSTEPVPVPVPVQSSSSGTSTGTGSSEAPEA
ncbi:hypothetical protein LUZ60_013258 [Juncus effusus]|nr:hypothetical protein LUZ60_013258 [Juncus effusus]